MNFTESDTLYDGVTAFPCDSTIMSDLKARKKYPDIIQKNIFVEESKKDF